MVIVGGVEGDWLEGEWIRGIRVDEGSFITFPTSHSPKMFATDMSNRTTSDLYPRVVGQHPRAMYSLVTAVGTITQLENRTFSRSFNREGPYPSIAQVCL